MEACSRRPSGHRAVCASCCCSATKSCPTRCDLWIVACRASLSFTLSWSLLKLISIDPVMSPNHLILCCPLLLLPSYMLQGCPLCGLHGGGADYGGWAGRCGWLWARLAARPCLVWWLWPHCRTGLDPRVGSRSPGAAAGPPEDPKMAVPVALIP